MATAPVHPVHRVDGGITVAIRLTPKARASGFNGTLPRPGGKLLKVSVTAAPERNKANSALLALLAKAWRLPKSAMHVASGQTDRNKLVHVAGDPDILEETLSEWMTAHRD